MTGRALCSCLVLLVPLHAQFSPLCPASPAAPEMKEGQNATRSDRARRAARARLGIKPEDPGPLRDAEVRQSLRTDYLPVVQEGIDDLETALQLDGNTTTLCLI